MTLTPAGSPSEQITAVGYQRAHAGKLMVIRRPDGRTPIASDFFHIESVGTHPTGLFVTGVFENDRRGHMMSTSVRDAEPSEIEWLRTTMNEALPS
jgi:hypothetical protein